MRNITKAELGLLTSEQLARALKFAAVYAHPLVAIPNLAPGESRRRTRTMTLGDLGPFGPECVHPPAMLEKLYPGSVSGRRK